MSGKSKRIRKVWNLIAPIFLHADPTNLLCGRENEEFTYRPNSIK